VTLSVKNAAGLSSGTNICIVKSDMTMELTVAHVFGQKLKRTLAHLIDAKIRFLIFG